MPQPSGFNFRILVVDDELSILKTSAAVLGTRGYEVRTAVDGFQALAELRRSLPDLVISDLRMPNMSGFELLPLLDDASRTLRSLPLAVSTMEPFPPG